MLAASEAVKERTESNGEKRAKVRWQDWRAVMTIWMIYDESLNINQKSEQDKRIMINGKNVVWMVSECYGEINWGWKRSSES